MITKIAHVCIRAGDLDRSIGFYGGIMGLKRKFDFVRAGKTTGVYFEVSNGNFIEIFGGLEGKAINTGMVHFCLETNDIDGMIDRFKSNGIDCTEKQLGSDRSYQAWVRDPDGNRIELHQYTPDSAQMTGKDIIVD